MPNAPGTAGLSNPFPGPVSLSKDHPVFGRDEEIADLRGLLLTERVVVLYGVSGAGKSSLLRGSQGIRDRFLQEKNFSVLGPVEFRLPSEGGGGEGFYEDYLLELLNKEEPEERQKENAEIWANIDLEIFLIRRANKIGCAYQLLIIDQFEDIFTQFPHDEAGKEAFFRTLGEMLVRNPNLWLVLAMREEYLGELDHYRKYVPGRFKATLRLELLRKEQASEAIIKTAEKHTAGARLCTKDVDALVDNLSQIVVDAGDGTQAYKPGFLVEPLFLQLACRDAWAQAMRGPRAAADNTGTIERGCIPLARGATHKELDGVLARFYTEAIEIVSAPEKGSGYKIRSFAQDGLISTNGLRNLVSLEHAKDKWGVSEEQLLALVAQHLIRQQKRNLVTYYELAHDRLVDPVKENNDAWLTAQPEWRRAARRWNQGAGGDVRLRLSELFRARSAKRLTPNALTPFEVQFIGEQKQASIHRFLYPAGYVVSMVLIGAMVALISSHQTISEIKASQQQAEDALDRAKEKEREADELRNVSSVNRTLGRYVEHKWVRRHDQAAVLQVLQAYQEAKDLFRRPEDRRRFDGALFTAFNNALTRFGNAPGFSHAPRIPAGVEQPVAFHGGQKPLMAYVQEGCVVVSHLKTGDRSNPCLYRVASQPVQLAFNYDGTRLAFRSKDRVFILDVRAGVGDDAVVGQATGGGLGAGVDALHFSADGHLLAYAAGEHVTFLCYHEARWADCGSVAVPIEPWDIVTVLGVSDEYDDGRMIAVGLPGGAVSLQRVAREDAKGSQVGVGRPLVATEAPVAISLKDARNVIALHFLSGDLPRLLIVHEDKQIYLATQAAPPAAGFDHRAVEADVGSRVSGSRPEEGDDHYASAAITTDRVLYTVLEDAIEAWDFKYLGAQPETDTAWQAPVVRNETGARDLKYLAVGGDFLIGQGFFRTWVWERGGGARSKLVRDEIPGPRAKAPGEHTFYPQAVAFGPKDDLVSGSSRYGLQHWQRNPDRQWSSERLGPCGELRSVRALSLSPDRTLVAAASSRSQLMVVALDRPNDPLLCDDSRHTDDLSSVAFSHDGRWLASGDSESNLLLWKISEGRQISYAGRISVTGQEVLALAFRPRRNLLAVGMRTDQVHLYSVADSGAATRLETLPFPDNKSIGSILSLDFSHDGGRLAAAGADGPIQVWTMELGADEGTATATAKPEQTLVGHAGGTRALAFNPSNALLVSGGADGLVRIWDSDHLTRTPATLRSVDADVLSVAWSGDGKRLATSFKPSPKIGSGEKDGDARHGKILTWSWDLEEFAAIACSAIWPSVIEGDGAGRCADLVKRVSRERTD